MGTRGGMLWFESGVSESQVNKERNCNNQCQLSARHDLESPESHWACLWRDSDGTDWTGKVYLLWAVLFPGRDPGQVRKEAAQQGVFVDPHYGYNGAISGTTATTSPPGWSVLLSSAQAKISPFYLKLLLSGILSQQWKSITGYIRPFKIATWCGQLQSSYSGELHNQVTKEKEPQCFKSLWFWFGPHL